MSEHEQMRPKLLEGYSFDNIKQEYFTVKELVSYYEGYITAVRNYAIWRSGEMLVGCLEQPFKEAVKEQQEIKDSLSAWLATIEVNYPDYWKWL